MYYLFILDNCVRTLFRLKTITFGCFYSVIQKKWMRITV